MNEGTLFVVSGPSGAGKSTLVLRLLEHLDAIGLSISATTRLPRPGEVDGVAYFFLTDEQFDEALKADKFIEWAHVHGYRYGTFASEVDRILATGKDLILEIDVQGGAQIKERYPNAISIFIEPPSLDELERRIRGRGGSSEESIKQRLENASLELARKERYNIVIVNDDFEASLDKLVETVLFYRNKR